MAIADQVANAHQETEQLLLDHDGDHHDDGVLNKLGEPLSRRSPFFVGFMAALGALIAYGLVHVVLELGQVITYIVVALFLALGLEPVVARLTRLGLRRGWSVLIVMITLVGVAALIGWIILPTFVDQISSLVSKTPGYINDLQHNRFISRFDHRFHIVRHLENQLKSGINGGTVTSVLGGVLGAGKAIVDGAVAVVVVVVLTLYLMAAMPTVKMAVYKTVPHTRRARVVFLSEEISRRVGGYVLGQATVAVINGVLTYLVLVLLGLPFPAVLAVLAGLLALIPIVGTIVGGVIITLVGFTGGWITAVTVLAYYVAYHVFEAYVLSPRVMRRAVDVPSAITIVAVLAGGTLLGVVGALIAIPVAAGLMLIYEQVLVPRAQTSGGPRWQEPKAEDGA